MPFSPFALDALHQSGFSTPRGYTDGDLLGATYNVSHV
jgi:hypothetical protein